MGRVNLFRRCASAALVLLSLAAGAVGRPAGAEPRSGADAARDSAVDTAVREGYARAYNLDNAEAVAALTKAAALAPDDPTPHRGLASIAWLNILFTRGTVTADEYLTRLARKDLTVSPPPAPVAAAFHEHVRRAVATAEQRIDANPRDAAAHYAYGSALALEASYTATIEGRVSAAFPTARRAYKAAERAIGLDPALHDAKLILGTYRYIVASQSLPTRLLAYVAGMDGDKEKGLALIEEAARARTEVQTEARFALTLLYNREGRLDDALRVIGQLQQQFPRNRILWLEKGATFQRAGRHGEAEQVLTDGLAMLERETRPRMFGELALWHYNRGIARASLQRDDEALSDLVTAVEAREAREWVRGRAHLELGRLLLRRNQPADARWQFDKAVRALERGRDDGPLAEARALLRD